MSNNLDQFIHLNPEDNQIKEPLRSLHQFAPTFAPRVGVRLTIHDC